MRVIIDEIRTRQDIELAQTAGEMFGQRLRTWPDTSGRLAYSLLGPRPVSRRLLREALNTLSVEDARRPSWSRATTTETLKDLDNALNLVAFSRASGFDGILVLNERDPVFGCFPLFDLFNPRAREALTEPEEERYDRRFIRTRRGLLQWVKRKAGSDERITWLDPHSATTGFMTLFADSLRSVIRYFNGSGTSHVRYTVHSRNEGYQLEYHPQFNFSPNVFGSNLTYRVSDTIRIGHYRFQGRRNGTLTADPGVYFAAPGHTEAELTAF
jgi:hypothetical protein